MNRNLLSIALSPFKMFAAKVQIMSLSHHQQCLNCSEGPPVSLDDYNKNKSPALEVIAAK